MRIGIVGLGLIGGSLGAALRRAGHQVVGHDIAPGRQERAEALGLVEATASLPVLAAGSDALILATPVLRIVAQLPVVDAAAPPDTVILDTGSAKAAVVSAMSLCPGAERMVGGHPLAGSERSGPDASDPDLFRGRPFVLTPTPDTSPRSLSVATQLVEDVGSRLVTLDAANHDRIVAGTSHLPQILASLLRRCVPPDPDLAGQGYDDMTRLAGSDPVLWRDVLLANAAEIADVTRRYRDSLDALLQAVEVGDATAIENLLAAEMVEAAR